MPDYRRADAKGATWFFTVSLLERRSNDLLTRNIALLRECVARIKQLHPFRIDACEPRAGLAAFQFSSAG